MMGSHKSLLALGAVLCTCSGGEPQFAHAVRMHAFNAGCPPTPARARGFRAHLFADLFADGDEEAVNALPTDAFVPIPATGAAPASPVAEVVAGSPVANQRTVGVAAPASPTTFAVSASPVAARGPLSFGSDSPDEETEKADDIGASAAMMSSPSSAQRAGSPACGGAATPPFQRTPPRSVPSVAFGGGNKLFHEQHACVVKLQQLEHDAERRLRQLRMVIPDVEFAMPAGAPEFSVNGNVVSFGSQLKFDKNYLVTAETSVLNRSVVNAKEIMLTSLVDDSGAGVAGAPHFIFINGCEEVEGDEDSISLGDKDLTLANAPTLHTHPGRGEDRHKYVELPPSSQDMKMMLKVIKREMTERNIGMDAELVAENRDVAANKWHFVLADIHVGMPEEQKVLYAFTIDPRIADRAVTREVVEGEVEIPRGFLRALDADNFPNDLASAERPREVMEEESFLAGGGGGCFFAAAEAKAAEGRMWLPGLAFTRTPGVFRVESTDLPKLTDAIPHSDHAGVCQQVSDRLVTPLAHRRMVEELRRYSLRGNEKDGNLPGKLNDEIENLCLRPQFPTAGFRAHTPDGKYPQRLGNGDRVELLNIDEVDAVLTRLRLEDAGEDRSRSARSLLRGSADDSCCAESPEKKPRTRAQEDAETANEPLVLKVRTERVKLSKRSSAEEGVIDADGYIDDFYQEAYSLVVKKQISFENFQRLCAGVGVYVQRVEL